MNAITCGNDGNLWGATASQHLVTSRESISVKALTDSTSGTSLFKEAILNLTGTLFIRNEYDDLVKGSVDILNAANMMEVDREIDDAVDHLVEAAFNRKMVKPLTRKV